MTSQEVIDALISKSQDLAKACQKLDPDESLAVASAVRNLTLQVGAMKLVMQSQDPDIAELRVLKADAEKNLDLADQLLAHLAAR